MIRRFGKTKRIISYHNAKETPEDLEEIAGKCAAADADIVKLATLASTVAEASRVLELAREARVSTIPIAMGEIGFFTRVLARKYGAPHTYAGFNPERAFAPGMPRYRALERDYFYERIDAQTEVYGVIGDPILQSLSPALHNGCFRKLGLNKVLVPFLIPEGTLEESLGALDWIGLKGYSVTIPHKELMARMLASMDGAVEKTHACNTVVIQNGQKVGYNTDYRAAMEALEDAYGGIAVSEDSSPLFEKPVLILGAGGAARSIAFGLARRGANVTITNRHDERAASLAEEVGCRTINWGQRAGTMAEIVINCTPVGMHPNVDDTPVPPATFSRPEMLAFDTVYHPENTMFLKLARERGSKTVSGAEMFIRQAAAQFRLYTGQDAPIDLMREILSRKLGSNRE
jgi:3-dehydroquinate dehydratase/shikimate dehydrogenase